MFCPRCGSQNSEETKFCRGCGTDISGVVVALEGRASAPTALEEKHIELFSSGIRGLTMGIGFLIVAFAAIGISWRLGVLTIFALAFSFVFLASGISRLVQASSLKRLRERDTVQPALPPSGTEYLKPPKSLYETDDLVSNFPGSITDHTTRHLKADRDKR